MAGVIRVPHERSAVRLARHAVGAQMSAAGLGSTALDDAVLVVSELVSNSVKHAAPLAGGGISVSWSLESDSVHVEITDGGGGTRPHAGVVAATAMGGRGLEIVRKISREWGVTEAADSVTVWAEVPRS